MGLVRTITSAFVAAILPVSGALGQTSQPEISAPTQYTAEVLDQMLAPVALYPDPLLAQIFMAATYPLEVVEADRWVAQQTGAALEPDQLMAALELQRWDPSVKSLVPFPQILRMMDNRLEWTERVGDAFLANQAEVMDAIQRLRQRAEAAGTLHSTPQEAVTTEDQAITIEPAGSETVYVPVYDPSAAYGEWPYPASPPDYFSEVSQGAMTGDLGLGWLSAVIVAPLWNWDRFNWVRHNIYIDPNRFAAINDNRPPAGNGVWQHDPSHRRQVPYRDPNVRDRFEESARAPDLHQDFRGNTVDAVPQVAPAAPGFQERQSIPQPYAPRTAPQVESFDRGPNVRMQSEIGHPNRPPIPRFAPRMGEPRPSPSVNGRERR